MPSLFSEKYNNNNYNDNEKKKKKKHLEDCLLQFCLSALMVNFKLLPFCLKP